jgi:CheY-like chemotaxis protein
MVSDRMVTKVLLVDDNQDTLDLLEMFLYRDFEILTAGNGFDGFNVAVRELPDLVITDIMMPVMDGIRLFNDLHRQQKTAGIPVVAMTAFLKRITRKSLLNMGFKGVISKPVNRERLLGMITRMLALPDSLSEVQVTDETV